MRLHALETIDADDKVALLFNAFMRALSTVDICCSPMYITVRECKAGFAKQDHPTKPGKKRKRSLPDQAERWFSLSVLCNSLHELHHQLQGLDKLLQDFDLLYSGDLHRFAVENRLRQIDEYGSDDPTDWYRDNEDDESEEWKVVRKEDPESLKHYTLHREVGVHFGDGDTRGEYIGTSTMADFSDWLTLVSNQSAFSWRKMIEALTGKEANVSTVQPDGELVPMTLGDHLEHELNEDLKGEDLASWFVTLIHHLGEMAEMYREMNPEDPDHYYKLREFSLQLQASLPTFPKPNPFGGLSAAV